MTTNFEYEDWHSNRYQFIQEVDRPEEWNYLRKKNTKSFVIKSIIIGAIIFLILLITSILIPIFYQFNEDFSKETIQSGAMILGFIDFVISLTLCILISKGIKKSTKKFYFYANTIKKFDETHNIDSEYEYFDDNYVKSKSRSRSLKWGIVSFFIIFWIPMLICAGIEYLGESVFNNLGVVNFAVYFFVTLYVMAIYISISIFIFGIKDYEKEFNSNRDYIHYLIDNSQEYQEATQKDFEQINKDLSEYNDGSMALCLEKSKKNIENLEKEKHQLESLIPESFCNEHKVNELIKILENREASSIKEAIDRYELKMHRNYIEGQARLSCYYAKESRDLAEQTKSIAEEAKSLAEDASNDASKARKAAEDAEYNTRNYN